MNSEKRSGAGTGLTANLPSLDRLPAPTAARKRASDLDLDLLAGAPTLDCGAPLAVYAPSGNSGTEALNPPAGTLAWAIFGVSGLNSNGSAIPLTLRAAGSADYYIALSDYSAGSWRILHRNGTEVYNIADGARALSRRAGAAMSQYWAGAAPWTSLR